jgi:hypothetical protein
MTFIETVKKDKYILNTLPLKTIVEVKYTICRKCSLDMLTGFDSIWSYSQVKLSVQYQINRIPKERSKQN